MQQSITQKVRFVLIISLILLFAMSFLAYSSFSRLIVASESVDRTYTIIVKLQRLMSNITEAETGQRGYLLTNDPAFLESYYGKRTRSAELYTELRTLLAENPVQQENLNTLNKLVAARFESLEQIIQQYRQKEAYDLGASNQLMQEVSALIGQMQQEEERLLADRRKKEQLYAKQSPVFIILLCFLSILVALVSFSRIRKDVRKRQEAEKLLADSNRHLERKVEARTQELRRNEERYRFMTESIPHIVWTASPKGKMDYFSHLIENYSGIPVSELLGWNWQQIIHPEDLQPTLQTWTQAVECGEENKIEHRLLGKDRVYRWMLSHAIPYKNEQGSVIKWFGTTTDIDEEKRATDMLRQQEDRLREITDALPVLISYIDSKLYYRFVNKKYESWFKLKREEILNRTIVEVIGEQAFQAVEPLLERTLQGEAVNEEFQTTYPAQGLRIMKMNTIPHWEGKKVLGFYTLLTDITAEKQAERQLRKALLEMEVQNMELNRVNLVLDDFVSMAAHDLKSPVSNLKLSVSLINKLEEPADKIKIIDQFDTSVQRLDRTLSGLLQILEVQQVKDVQTELCRFEDILNQVLENLGDRLLAVQGQLEFDFTQAPAIHYIKPYLLSTFSNLISNAIKYASAERPLQIQLYSRWVEDCVEFSCTDNGIGMDLDKIGSKVFKPFKRFSSQAEGTGVGLHLVKSIVEKTGGRIEIKSQAGKGTSLRCFFKNLSPMPEEV